MEDDEHQPGVQLELEVPPIPKLAALLPSDPLNPPRRADLISQKLRLAALLPPEEGQSYWAALVAFCTGKINREELGQVISKVLGHGEALQLHNALLLSILYNTTRPFLPPSSVRHTGWHKRKRDKDIEDRDPKRRKIKAAVMALGKRERADIKLLVTGGRRDKLKDEDREGLLSAALDSKGARAGKDGLPEALADTKAPSATLQEDYMRCLQTPLCSESKLLPDVNTLKDRMSLLAYESGVGGGADPKVAQLGVMALEGHLKNMITSAITLVRSRRSANIPSTTSTSFALPSSATSDDFDTPLCAADFQALFDISPHLLVLPHFGAVERLYAFPASSSSDESSSEDSEDEGEAGAPTPRTPGLTRARTLSRAGSRTSRSGSGSGNAFGRKGREQFVIDPSALDIPQGHPDVVAHPRHGSLSLPNGTNGAAVNGNGILANGSFMDVDLPPGSAAPSRRTSLNNGARASLPEANAIPPGPVSPKSLRNQLFPELAGPTAEPAVMAAAHPPSSPGHNHTTTDAGDTSDEEIKLLQQPRGRGRPPSGTGPRELERAQAQKKKLWEVVDSVALLDGVLE